MLARQWQCLIARPPGGRAGMTGEHSTRSSAIQPSCRRAERITQAVEQVRLASPETRSPHDIRGPGTQPARSTGRSQTGRNTALAHSCEHGHLVCRVVLVMPRNAQPDSAPATTQTRTVRIAALGDLHCTRTSTGKLHALFSQISESADMLLLAGDLTDTG